MRVKYADSAMASWGRKNKLNSGPSAGAIPQSQTPDPSVEIEIGDVDASGPMAAAAPAAGTRTYIGDGMEIKGSISTGSSLVIAGFVEGDVNSAAQVEIVSDAVVQGTVTAQVVNVAGTIEGNVNASGRLHIAATGTVDGDVEVKSLKIEEGGSLSGRCKMLS